jgi:uncharacterized membrane protein
MNLQESNTASPHSTRPHYNRIAGQSLERLAALSDGIFAVALTLLVLDLHVPAVEMVRSERALWGSLLQLGTHLLPYLLSFLTLGIFWIGHQTQLNHFVRSDRTLTWLHLGFLLTVTLTPFSTALLATFITFRVALIVYWLNLLLMGTALFLSWTYAERSQLIKENTSAETRRAMLRRIIVYQTLYACSVVLCPISNYVSIVLIILLQLNSVIAPRIHPLNRF